MRSRELARLVRSYAESLPGWTPHGPFLLRRLGPVLQVILFNTSRWKEDLYPFAGFTLLGLQPPILGLALGDTLKGKRGIPLVMPENTSIPRVVETLREQVRPDPGLPLEWKEILEIVRIRVAENPPPHGLHFLCRVELYLGNDAEAHEVLSRMGADEPGSDTVRRCSFLLEAPLAERRKQIDADAAIAVEAIAVEEKRLPKSIREYP